MSNKLTGFLVMLAGALITISTIFTSADPLLGLVPMCSGWVVMILSKD